MNKQMLIGLGVVVAGYLAYKHFKKTETVKVPEISKLKAEPIAIVNPSSGKPMVVVG